MDQKERSQTLNQNFESNLRAPQAAKYLGISKSKLAKLRMATNRAEGPRFSKIAGCVIYRRADLDAWIEANLSVIDGCAK